MGKKRLFTATSQRRGTEIDFSTTLTDAQAVKLLGGIDAPGFAGKTAMAINALKVKSANVDENLVAWGFFNAQKIADGAGPKAACVLSAQIQARVRCGKPYRAEVKGCTLLIKQGGPNAAVPGRYAIDDGGEYRKNEFYGFGDDVTGAWQPRNATPMAVIDWLTSETVDL